MGLTALAKPPNLTPFPVHPMSGFFFLPPRELTFASSENLSPAGACASPSLLWTVPRFELQLSKRSLSPAPSHKILSRAVCVGSYACSTKAPPPGQKPHQLPGHRTRQLPKTLQTCACEANKASNHRNTQGKQTGQLMRSAFLGLQGACLQVYKMDLLLLA